MCRSRCNLSNVAHLQSEILFPVVAVSDRSSKMEARPHLDSDFNFSVVANDDEDTFNVFYNSRGEISYTALNANCHTISTTVWLT